MIVSLIRKDVWFASQKSRPAIQSQWPWTLWFRRLRMDAWKCILWWNSKIGKSRVNATFLDHYRGDKKIETLLLFIRIAEVDLGPVSGSILHFLKHPRILRVLIKMLIDNRLLGSKIEFGGRAFVRRSVIQWGRAPITTRWKKHLS